MAKRKKCAHCDNEVKKFPLCQSCLLKEGADYTASNFDLRGLSVDERRLVFLWACGQDISEYFDNHSVPFIGDDSNLVDVLDKSLPPGISGFLAESSPRKRI